MTDLELCEALQNATEDEREIFSRFVTKLMGEGRADHGPLYFAVDAIDPSVDLDEAQDELTDVAFYLLRRLESISRTQVGVQESVSSTRVLREQLKARDALILQLRGVENEPTEGS